MQSLNEDDDDDDDDKNNNNGNNPNNNSLFDGVNDIVDDFIKKTLTPRPSRFDIESSIKKKRKLEESFAEIIETKQDGKFLNKTKSFQSFLIMLCVFFFN